jgi:hypothetical protein
MKSTQYLVCAFAIVTWLFAALCAIPAGVLVYVRYIHGPTLVFPLEPGKDKLPDDCETTTYDLADLVVDEKTSREKAKEIATEHGAAVVRNVLTKETAQAFRDYVMKANNELNDENQIYVHENEHRFNLLPDQKEPSVREMLKQVGEHPKLRPLIDDLMGPSASLINISVLTVEYGATDQDLHSDTSTSVASHPDYFVPEYSIVLALQDTTKDMGATHLCPGTHKCSHVESTDNDDDLNAQCRVRASMEQGDGFIYISDLHHRGTEHIDPKAEARALVFLIFAGTRQGKDDKRMLPLGQVRALKWDMWGHTIDEFADVHKWRLWHSFGLFQNRKDGLRPWNVLDDIFSIFQDDEEHVHMIDNDFGIEEFENVYDKVFRFIFVAGCAYLVCAPIVFFFIFVFVKMAQILTRRKKTNYSYDVRMNGKAKVA